MFKDRDHARTALAALVDDDAPLFSPGDVAFLTERLIAQFALESDARPDAAGSTRLGGTPDLPPGRHWPIRPAPADASARAAGLHERHRWIGAHITRDLPFEFLAQIDLAEIAGRPGAADLPPDGRLLFFWDGVVGLMFEGAAACRVIFDQTPKDALRRAETPALLHELEAAYDPEGRYKKPYIYPSRRMALAPNLALPSSMCCEALVDVALSARLDEEEFAEAYRFATAMDEGFFKREDRGANRQRLLGAPDPEQDDPRYNALDPAELPPYPWSPEASRDAARRALDWRLLLQLDLGDLSQQSLTEGAVYFVIARDDLAQRDFSRVRAYYQQT